MKWIKIKDSRNPRNELPLDKPFIALWKGNFAFMAYDVETTKFCMALDPSMFGTSSAIDDHAELKIYYYCPLEYPEDW